MCVLIFSKRVFLKHFKKKWARYDFKKSIGLYEQHQLFSSDINETEFSQQIFGKPSNIKFHENLSIESLVVPCRRT